MLLEVLFRGFETSVVLDVQSYVEAFNSALPFTSEAIVWKHEIYFSTPVELGSRESRPIYRVERGGVYYWPPGKALCLFYGFSQPYTPVLYLGRIVDPLNIFYGLGPGGVEVSRHSIDDRLTKVVEVLRGLGYTAATPVRKGERTVVAYRVRGGHRYSYTLSVEDYGVYIEGEGLAKYRDDPSTIEWVQTLESAISDRLYSRVDLTEDGYIAITATAKDLGELPKAIEDLEKALDTIYHLLKKTGNQ